MKSYDDLTEALQAILLHYSRGYTVWVQIETTADKLPALREKWAEQYGTLLPAWKRQDRKQKGLPNVVAVAAPILSRPGKREVILMSTGDALRQSDASPFAREKWLQRLPEFSEFVLVHEPRPRGDYAWTWRLQERVAGGLEKHLKTLAKAGDAVALGAETHHMVKLYPLFGGVRRQIRRVLHSTRKLWLASRRGDWPGPDPDHLPAMIGFRRGGQVAKEDAGVSSQQAAEHPAD
ncbi:MAG: hypothetical protein JO142_02050 [Burkholderiales bacterium]|nr:hypothetical protein [Burkholderiales bacterium]